MIIQVPVYCLFLCPFVKDKCSYFPKISDRLASANRVDKDHTAPILAGTLHLHLLLQ